MDCAEQRVAISLGFERHAFLSHGPDSHELSGNDACMEFVTRRGGFFLLLQCKHDTTSSNKIQELVGQTRFDRLLPLTAMRYLEKLAWFVKRCRD